MRELAMLCSTLSGASGSSGMVLAMHFIQVACIMRHADGSALFQEYMREIVREQYLLASLLLAQPARFRLLMSSAFVSYDLELRREASELFAGSGLAYMFDKRFHSGGVRGLSGMSLWLEVM